MRKWYELAMKLGSLEARVEQLEKQASVQAAEASAMTADKLLQQGIDNIMSYQWPPAKGAVE